MITEKRVAEILRRTTGAIPVQAPPAEALRKRARTDSDQRLRASWRPALLAGAAVVATVVAVATLPVLRDQRPVSPPPTAASDPYPYRLPWRVAGAAAVKGTVSAAPPGRAVALFRSKGSYVVLSANGTSYRRLDGVPDGARALLAPNGLAIAVGEPGRVTDRVTVVDVRTGKKRAYPVTPPVAARPIAWSGNSGLVAFATQRTPGQGGAGPAAVAILELASGEVTQVYDPMPGTVGLLQAAFGPVDRKLTLAAGAPGGCEIRVVSYWLGVQREADVVDAPIAGCDAVESVALESGPGGGLTRLVEVRGSERRLSAYARPPAQPADLPRDRTVPAGTTIAGAAGTWGIYYARPDQLWGHRSDDSFEPISTFAAALEDFQLASGLLPLTAVDIAPD